MLSFLKKHPFPVQAFFEYSLVLSFAIPKMDLERKVPPCLEIDTFEKIDKKSGEKQSYGFVAVAMVKTKYLRPKGFPRMMGNDFFLIGYRIFVNYTNSKGKRLRGLYILKSETDKLKMKVLGGLFTHYNYSVVDIQTRNADKNLIISSKQTGFVANVAFEDNAELPENSPFDSWKKARRFAGPLPNTFTFDSKTNQVLIIKGKRKNWRPQPVKVLEHNIPFLDTFAIEECTLANAFVIENVPYEWEKGKIDTWNQSLM